MSEACLVVHAPGEAAAALHLAGGRPLVFLSAEGAAGFLGPRGWLALLARTGSLAPGLPFTGFLCCGAAPGHAFAALRAGCLGLVLAGAHTAFAAVAGAAREAGAILLPARPPALDLRNLDLRKAAAQARLALWLTGTPHDSAARGR